jgi:hypothetical protein
MKMTMSKWATLVVLTGVLLAGAGLGEDHGPCYEAYLQSGLTQKPLSFDRFHDLYGDTFCTPGDEATGAHHEAQALRASR